MKSLDSQKGVALITVLLVFAIATIVSSKILLSHAIDVKRVTAYVDRTQAYYYARAAEQLAMLALQADYESDQNDIGFSVDHKDEYWAQGPEKFELDLIGEVWVEITDLHSFYNLNNIWNPSGGVNEYELDRFASIIDALGYSRDLVDNLRDYIDSDKIEHGVDSERRYYEEAIPAYSIANQLFSDVSELGLIKDFTPEVVEALRPHVTVIKVPTVVSLNVNTATDYALTSLQKSTPTGKSKGPNGIGITQAQAIAELQGYEYFNGIEKTIGKGAGLEFIKHPAAYGISQGPGRNDMTAHGIYFEINVQANYAGTTAYLSTIVVEKPPKPGDTRSSYQVLERRETDNFHRFIDTN